MEEVKQQLQEYQPNQQKEDASNAGKIKANVYARESIAMKNFGKKIQGK